MQSRASLAQLSKRWYPLRPIESQMAYVRSPHLYNVVPAGRRSGKTERAKRKVVTRALSLDGITHDQSPRFFCAAPTRDQAKHIFWDDLKELTRPFWMRQPAETELMVFLVTGAIIQVVGMDKPERIEGSPWDGGILDEYGNMKERAWSLHIEPALADRNGWCDFIGVPEGRNHYYKLATKAQAQMASHGAQSPWGYFHWKSSEVLPADRVELARQSLDPLSFEQEYEGSFVNFEGRAYYGFSDRNKAPVRRLYNASQPLIVCLDFNVAPGVAVILQELPIAKGLIGTAAIGEVWIKNNSNTPAVCRRILKDWGEHQGRIEVFGDSTGGAGGTAKIDGSDWDLVTKTLKRGDQGLAGFGERVTLYVKRSNPPERARVNAVNTRCLSGDGTRRFMVDPEHCEHLVDDLEGVTTLVGGSGEIDKKKNPELTHLSDAVGYYVESRFPVQDVSQWGTSRFKHGN